MRVTRRDIGELQRPQRLDNGWLRVEGYIARTGVQEYEQPDGTIRRELRLPEEVFDSEAMASFSLVPVCDSHPPEMLTASNAREYAVGAVGEQVSRDGERIRAKMMIFDSGMVQRLDHGVRQVSCGYSCELDDSPGEWQGERYDAIQRNIRGNHVAIVPIGRAGQEVAVRTDTAAKRRRARKDQDPEPDAGNGGEMMMVTIGERDYEIPMAMMDAMKADLADDGMMTMMVGETPLTLKMADTTDADDDEEEKKMDARRRADADKERARADALAAELGKLRSGLSEMVSRRVALESHARRFLGERHDCSAMSDHALRVAALKRAYPQTAKRFDSDTETYVQARFDALVECGETNLADVQHVDSASTAHDPVSQAIERRNARHRELSINGKAG